MSKVISLLSEIKLPNKTNEIQVNNKHPSKEIRTSSYEVLLNSALGSGSKNDVAEKTRHVGFCYLACLPFYLFLSLTLPEF